MRLHTYDNACMVLMVSLHHAICGKWEDVIFLASEDPGRVA